MFVVAGGISRRVRPRSHCIERDHDVTGRDRSVDPRVYRTQYATNAAISFAASLGIRRASPFHERTYVVTAFARGHALIDIRAARY